MNPTLCSIKRPRILFVDHTGTLGGAELSLVDLATAYRGSSQVLLFEDGPLRERLAAAGVEVMIIPVPSALLGVRSKDRLSSIRSIPALWQAAYLTAKLSRDYDLVHANSQKAFIVAALASLWDGTPVIWHLRDILTASHYSQINRRVAVWLANKCARRVFVNSLATGSAFVAAGGQSELISVVYNGISPDPFTLYGNYAAEEIRSQLGLDFLCQAPVVGIFSRLAPWKGQHIVLEALQHLPDVHVLMVGEALFGEDEYVAHLKAQSMALQLTERVHWLGFRTDIPQLMAACDIIVHASTEPEPFGRVIVEGQLSQRPVIAVAAGGALELIEDGLTGWLIPANNAPALAAAIMELLSRPDTAKALAQQGCVRAHQRFTLEVSLSSFDQNLQALWSVR